MSDPKIQLVSGKPVPEDRSHTALKPNGQQQDYVVLTPEERARGFVKPLRHAYLHRVCGGETRMSPAIAETYARDPTFYCGTYCVLCGKHFPLAQFSWLPDGEPMDPSLQAEGKSAHDPESAPRQRGTNEGHADAGAASIPE